MSQEQKLTPMMKQYLDIKAKYPNDLVFYRLGDFYELFLDDAKKAAKILDLTLTKRGTNNGDPIAMCGVPFHAVDGYLSRLIKLGVSAVICEQEADPNNKKGMMIRKVSKILTPGTVIEEGIAPDTDDNKIACVYKGIKSYAFAVLSLSSGKFIVANCADQSSLSLFIDRYNPCEILTDNALYSFVKTKEIDCIKPIEISLSDYNKYFNNLNQHFNSNGLYEFDLHDNQECIIAAGILLEYVKNTQSVPLNNISCIHKEYLDQIVIIDNNTQKNLELIYNLTGQKDASLYHVLDKTSTIMGSRLLKEFIIQPLLDNNIVNYRLNIVENLISSSNLDDISTILKSISDIQRITARITLLSAKPKDLYNLKTTLSLIPNIKQLLSQHNNGSFDKLLEQMPELDDIYQLLDSSILDTPSTFIRDGNVIKDGYNAQLDQYRDLMNGASSLIKQIEINERNKTNLSTLKVDYNLVHGFYIEVSKLQAENVPVHYQRRQTLKNTERYITPELKELEEKTFNAKAQAIELEKQIYDEILKTIDKKIDELYKLANSIALLDVLQSFANIAIMYNYVKPKLTEQCVIQIDQGRHPVIESLSDKPFISNDVTLNDDINTLIISGPNMGGKSTYMRQIALITIMARIGSYVPAKNATIGFIDRIFTRIGASDDLVNGRSTFMVEMQESANILNNASSCSLVIMDEVGRGTSSLEGQALALSIIDYIVNNIKCLTLFATHYSNITEQANVLKNTKNICFKASEHNNQIVFLYKATEGSSPYSYAIEVAKLAGIPNHVISKAKENLMTINEGVVQVPISQKDDRYSSFLNKLELDKITPLEALNILYRLKEL